MTVILFQSRVKEIALVRGKEKKEGEGGGGGKWGWKRPFKLL